MKKEMDVQIVLPKRQSPIRAIRKFCVECSGGRSDEVKYCCIPRCPLFPYRFGKLPNTYVENHPRTVIVNEKGKKI